MVVSTKFFTVRAEDLSGIGRNEKNTLYLVFKSGTTQTISYDDKAELTEDYLKLHNALHTANKEKTEKS